MSSSSRPGSGRLRHVVWAASAALAVGLVACNSSSPSEVEFQVIEELTFDPALGVDLAAMTKLPEGVYIQDLVVGTGEGLEVGDHAWTYYWLWLHTGAGIAAGYHQFDLGDSTSVIQGWNVGLVGMAPGGARLLVIPPELGYGARGRGAVPGGAVLVFRVELDSIT